MSGARRIEVLGRVAMGVILLAIVAALSGACASALKSRADFYYPDAAEAAEAPARGTVVGAGGVIGGPVPPSLPVIAPDSTVSSVIPVVDVPGGAAPGETPPPPMKVDAKKRLVIYTANFAILVAKVEDAMNQLREMVDDWDGFIQTADLSRMTFRVPAANFDRAVEQITRMGVVISKQIRAEDVTSQYRDLQLRAEVAEESRKRMMAILENADKMKDIIEIEKEIRRLTEEIERIKAQLRTMADRIVYSTITVEFQAKAPPPKRQIERPRRQHSYFAWINEIGAESVIRDFNFRFVPRTWFPKFKVSPPEGFVRVGSKREEFFRALTSEEDKLRVRRHKVTELGSLDFWTAAVKGYLVGERGYTLIEEGEIETDAGLPGHRFQFEISISDVPYVHEVVLFVTQTDWRWLLPDEQHIYAVAFLCEKKNYAEHKEAVHNALKQFVAKRGNPLDTMKENTESAS